MKKDLGGSSLRINSGIRFLTDKNRKIRSSHRTKSRLFRSWIRRVILTECVPTTGRSKCRIQKFIKILIKHLKKESMGGGMDWGWELVCNQTRWNLVFRLLFSFLSDAESPSFYCTAPEELGHTFSYFLHPPSSHLRYQSGELTTKISRAIKKIREK